MILEKQYQKWESVVALRFFVALPVRMPGTSERRALGERDGTRGEGYVDSDGFSDLRSSV